jgi:hypothetical protein
MAVVMDRLGPSRRANTSLMVDADHAEVFDFEEFLDANIPIRDFPLMACPSTPAGVFLVRAFELSVSLGGATDRAPRWPPGR